MTQFSPFLKEEIDCVFFFSCFVGSGREAVYRDGLNWERDCGNHIPT